MVIYVCPEMLESSRFAKLVHSKSWKNSLSAIYIDEAHLVHLQQHWSPPYSRLYRLREIIGYDIPLLALSATCPKVFRDALILYAGLKPDYTLYNGGNFRPELSTIILVMAYDASSFEDISFVIPSGCRASQLKKTII